MSRWIRRAAAVVAASAVLSLAACGGGEQRPPQSQPQVAQGKDGFRDADKRTAEFGTAAKPGEFPRTIRHAKGETRLERRPERVVVLDTGELDNVVALGVQPVGVAYTEGSPTMPSYVGDRGGQPVTVGTNNNLNFEAIQNLRPDLILGSVLRLDAQYDKLAAIAPTVFTLRPGFTWKENFRVNAAALDRSADADRLIADYERHAKEVGQRVEQKLGHRPSISMLRFMTNKVRLYAAKSFVGTILNDAGLPRPEKQRVDDLAVEISTENLSMADADWIFVGSYGDPTKTGMDAALAGPLWSQLGAVKAGHAQKVADETWFLGLGLLAANSVLDDLEKRLTQS
ncbi:iron complex transport system substrate-binding protein [Streptoalloteichus tenebrarius]|uniref:Iron complex transport system substrate-binding protein n=1 Tax=Streptoalloteichus tenebrarius (strain ATCC 17920 / DSM 40477 / JCM 4838 / CBS 697.72 / NBRC 16177 / NCIMB 11028 / NRRL B-12390 / A12253. 1 / ISP 5477) TaxID=1933 RepID=A0ABT1HZW2_STRSD|nr:iron-siderophore ABC transporter substrate-binding protein [Streptoalloteichus tenebrarius]MCP2261041.1 iron complex transport system substrate-binding protein [Streptoalloteichus tenebrarius]BFF03166.1 iron-siderophore ABC transporter substrate-binding protein [Streptoalloteichus tenebrarius]